jgi:hypothetical protein
MQLRVMKQTQLREASTTQSFSRRVCVQNHASVGVRNEYCVADCVRDSWMLDHQFLPVANVICPTQQLSKVVLDTFCASI